jgi:hypothetical protein
MHSKPKSKLKEVAPSSVRCTFTLPHALYADISAVSMAMGVSRSALLVSVLGDSIQDMAIDIADARPEPGVMLRLRGRSIDKVEALYQQFMEDMGEPEGSRGPL